MTTMTMMRAQLHGHLQRLRRDLAAARTAAVSTPGLADRLQRELALVECEIVLYGTPATGWQADRPRVRPTLGDMDIAVGAMA